MPELKKYIYIYYRKRTFTFLYNVCVLRKLKVPECSVNGLSKSRLRVKQSLFGPTSPTETMVSGACSDPNPCQSYSFTAINDIIAYWEVSCWPFLPYLAFIYVSFGIGSAVKTMFSFSIETEMAATIAKLCELQVPGRLVTLAP